MKDPDPSFGVANNYLASSPVVCLIMSVIDSRSMNKDEICEVGPLRALQPRLRTVYLSDEDITKHIETPGLKGVQSLSLYSHSEPDLQNLSTHNTLPIIPISDNPILPINNGRGYRARKGPKMSYWPPVNSLNIFQRMHRANWRSGKFPDGSLDLKLSSIPVDQIFRLVPRKSKEFDFKEDKDVGELSYEDCKSPSIPGPVYMEGRRCGIIPVDIRQIGNREVVSFLTVLGRSTRDDRGRLVNIWSWAKGRMEPHESHAQCAAREFWEETGIMLKGVEELPRINIGKNIYFILHTTRDALCQFSPKDRKEVERVEWKTADELRNIVSTSYILPVTANKDIRQVIQYPQRKFPFHQIIYTHPRNLFDLIEG
jgi:ADP-ribose pyrophosphatase YjhB (NUDIX family)